MNTVLGSRVLLSCACVAFASVPALAQGQSPVSLGNSNTQSTGTPNAQPIADRQVQTTYDTSPSANGPEGGGGEQKAMEVKGGNEISPHMPQVGGPTQTNYHLKHAHAAVTQTKVIFAGGQAIKVDQPVMMEYSWPSAQPQPQPRAQYGYARIIPRSPEVHRRVK